VTVKTGTLIDATVIASASHQDGEAGWAAHRTRKAVHGFKAHDRRRRRLPRLSRSYPSRPAMFMTVARAMVRCRMILDPSTQTAPTEAVPLPPRCRPKEGFLMSFRPAYGDAKATGRCKS